MQKKITISSLQKLKNAHEKIAVLTAYDASFAQLLDNNGVEIILVGDSLGMVLQGHTTTAPVTVNDMVYHTQCVARGNQHAFIMADMPFMSFADEIQAYDTATQLIQAGANMVKIEGGQWLCATVSGLTQRGISVCGHVGLKPQSVNALGGYKIQGKTTETAEQIVQEAKALEAAGAQMLVVECVPASVGKQLSESVNIPVIGIGAGPDTDGQVLVLQDMLGISTGYTPSFSKNFLAEQNSIAQAIQSFVTEVKQKKFPTKEHSFS